MVNVPSHTIGRAPADLDQRVYLRNVPWSQYEALLALRGESSVPRLTYLLGDLELMSPSEGHETTSETLGRLIVAYAEEIGVDLWAYGSWTLKRGQKRGAEPDKCYCVGSPQRKGVPDLAVEVVWTHGGIDKLEVYRDLEVREVWLWEAGAIEVFELREGTYERIARSLAFPDLDLGLVARLAMHGNPSQSVRELRAWARGPRA
jgi:Uma2 family endonuclease